MLEVHISESLTLTPSHPPLSQVFEVHISEPREVSVLTRMDEYRALRAANARFFGNPSQPVGHLEQEVMAGNRIYLQVKDRRGRGGGRTGARAFSHCGNVVRWSLMA